MTYRPAITVSALLVYVSALLGGSLHHHDVLAATESGKSDRDVVAACSQDDFDDGHDCAICQAIAQARVQSPPPPVVAFTTSWQPATILPCNSPDLARHNATQARAPPR
jgi:hypothetical protein